MKKIILLMGVIVAHAAAAQTSDNVIRSMPQFTQGYLVLDKNNNPEVMKWTVQVFETEVTDDGPVTTMVMNTNLPSGKNYLRIPAEYRTRSVDQSTYEFRVAGYNSDNQLMVQTGMVPVLGGADPNFACVGCPGGAGIPDCEKTCNGLDYAYTITKWPAAGSSAYYTLDLAFDYFDPVNQIGIHYYEYMNASTLNTWCNSPSVYFSHPAVDCYPDNYDNLLIAGPFDADTFPFYDRSNNPLYGNDIFAVAKGRGIWEDGSTTGGNIYTPDLLDQGLACGYDLDHFISLMNAYSNTASNLNCVETLNGSTISGVSWGNADCLGDFFGDTTNFTGWINDLDSCYTLSGYTGGFSSMVRSVVIRNIDGSSAEPLTASIGELTSGEITLQPGLYTYGLMLGNVYMPRVFEVHATNGSKMAESANIEIFPVPMESGGNYQLTIAAAAETTCTYEVFDLLGRTVYTERFSVDGTRVEKTIPALPVESGTILLHRFSFSDGSVTTRKTVVE